MEFLIGQGCWLMTKLVVGLVTNRIKAWRDRDDGGLLQQVAGLAFKGGAALADGEEGGEMVEWANNIYSAWDDRQQRKGMQDMTQGLRKAERELTDVRRVTTHSNSMTSGLVENMQGLTIRVERSNEGIAEGMKGLRTEINRANQNMSDELWAISAETQRVNQRVAAGLYDRISEQEERIVADIREVGDDVQKHISTELCAFQRQIGLVHKSSEAQRVILEAGREGLERIGNTLKNMQYNDLVQATKLMDFCISGVSLDMVHDLQRAIETALRAECVQDGNVEVMLDAFRIRMVAQYMLDCLKATCAEAKRSVTHILLEHVIKNPVVLKNCSEFLHQPEGDEKYEAETTMVLAFLLEAISSISIYAPICDPSVLLNNPRMDATVKHALGRFCMRISSLSASDTVADIYPGVTYLVVEAWSVFTERRCLQDLYKFTLGSLWRVNTGWNGDEPELQNWYGVTVEDNHVTKLFLAANNLHGSIPNIWRGLPKLRELSLAVNHLSGRVPDSLYSIPKLRVLDLSGNHLSGSPPPRFLPSGGPLQTTARSRPLLLESESTSSCNSTAGDPTLINISVTQCLPPKSMQKDAIDPGDLFLRGWIFKNNSNKSLPPGCCLVNVVKPGDPYTGIQGLSKLVHVGHVPAGAEFCVTVRLAAPRTYVRQLLNCTWQLRTYAGEFFGPKVLATVRVRLSSARTQILGADGAVPSLKEEEMATINSFPLEMAPVTQDSGGVHLN